MFIGDLFNKKQLNESLRDGEYYTFKVFFDDGTDETLNFGGDDIDWDRVGAKRGKKVINVKQQGGIRGSQSDAPRKPYDFPDDRGLARAQRAYDRQLPEGVAEAAGLYGPFTLTINTGERPNSRTKTKKFRREDDAILWAEDWFEDFPQYVFATAEITDPEGNVVWYSDETMVSGQGVAEAGPFSYGAKKPRKGSVADLAAKKRQEQERGRQPIEPRDQMVGTAKILPKDVAEGSVQDKLHKRHQELRKKSGLPDPDYYKELKATYDLPDEERYAKAAELKKKYQVKEARKAEQNFDIEDIKNLESIKDLATLKLQAFNLISRPSAKPMKPEKVEWFKQRLEDLKSPMAVIKLMYDLLLSGEGHRVIGSKHSMNPNSYRGRFGENTITNEDVEKYIEELGRAGYEIITESATLCPECGGPAYSDQILAEKQDACYSKVKSRYKVWPSAYASGALVRCRKVGAKNWGNKSKK